MFIININGCDQWIAYSRGIGICDGTDAGETFKNVNTQIIGNTISDCTRAFTIVMSANGYKYINKNIIISNNIVILTNKSDAIIRLESGITGVTFNNNIFQFNEQVLFVLIFLLIINLVIIFYIKFINK